MPKDSRETIPQSTCKMYQSFKHAKPAGKRIQKQTPQKSHSLSQALLDYTQLHNTKDLYPVTLPWIPLGIQKRGPQSVPSLLQPGPIHNLVKARLYDTHVTAMFSAEQLSLSIADSMRLLCCEYLPTTAIYPDLGSTTRYLCLAMHAIGVSYMTLYQPYGFSRLMN
uniref:Uncharacterized protein B10C3.045 n=1 Tax=Neurospora crassa TaxID=5141 RepID=Q873F7_NEUCS|nr:hypothetical protein [Neurospora crassa]